MLISIMKRTYPKATTYQRLSSFHKVLLKGSATENKNSLKLQKTKCWNEFSCIKLGQWSPNLPPTKLNLVDLQARTELEVSEHGYTIRLMVWSAVKP